MFTKIKQRMESDEPIKFLFAGDSITHGALHTYGLRDYTEHFSERVRTEMVRQRDIIIKSGISGWTTKHILEDIEWNMLQFNADIVSLMIGMNDCATPHNISVEKYKENYNSILDQVEQRNNPLVMLHVPNPIWESGCDLRGNLPHYAQAVREIGAERQLPVIDHEAYWKKAIEESPIRFTAWMNDSLHPNNFGHLAFAHLMFKEMGIWDDNSCTCRMFKP